MAIECLTRTPAETMDFAAALAPHLRGGDILALRGPLGAGKTCFVRGLARGLGIAPTEVSSPTFIICQEYEGDGQIALAHLDLYRLFGEDELESIGWSELVAAPDLILAIEWPERIETALAKLDTLEVSFEHVGLTQRRLTLTARGELAHRLEHVREELAGSI